MINTNTVSTYNQLCPVVFGVGATAQLGEKAKEYNAKKAMVIYDQGVKVTGMSDRIVKILNDAGVETVEFDGVLSDAPDYMVNEAGKIAQDEKVDLIVGIGGGSSLDTAKAVAILADNPLPVSTYYPSNGGQFVTKSKLIVLPTASGTGSEVTIMAVIHDMENDTKNFVLRPADLAIVDPELTVTVPAHITAATGLDALSHAIESFTTNCGNPKADILALEATRLIAKNLEKAVKDGSDIEARAKLSFASNIAGMAFTDASVHFGHCAAHEFGVKFHMHHGVGCAIALPEVIAFSEEIIPEKTIQIAKALGCDVKDGMTGKEAGEMAAAKVRELMRKVGIKSLKEQGISREDAVECAEGAITKNWFIICALEEINVDKMKELIGKMYDNYQ